jgi:uncharacterized protein (DUF3084 family)
MISSELECALLALDKMQAQLDEARRQLKVMTEEHRLACEDRDLMQRERDEARRMVCGLDADIMEDQVEYARHRGWDCFGLNMCKEAQHDLEADTHPG